MAIIGSLVIGIKASLDSSFERETKKATSYAQKLGKSFSDRLIGTAAVLRTATAAASAFADELERIATVGFRSSDSLERVEEFLVDGIIRRIPVVGHALKAIDSGVEIISRWITGAEAFGVAIERDTKRMEALAKATASAAKAAKLRAAATAEFQAGRSPTEIAKAQADLAIELEKVSLEYQKIRDAVLDAVESNEQYMRIIADVNRAEAERKQQIIDEATGIFELVRSLQAAIDGYGRSAESIALMKAEAMGASPAMIALARSLMEQKAALDAAAEAARQHNALAKEAADLIAEWEFELANFGRTARELDIERLRMAGANEEQLERLRLLDEELKRRERLRDLEQEAQRIRESLLTPYEIYLKQLERLKELLEESLLTQEEFRKAVAKAQDELRRVMGGIREIQNPGAVERRFTNGFPGAARVFDPLKELERTEKQHFLEARRQTPIFTRIESKLSSLQNPVIVNL